MSVEEVALDAATEKPEAIAAESSTCMYMARCVLVRMVFRPCTEVSLRKAVATSREEAEKVDHCEIRLMT